MREALHYERESSGIIHCLLCPQNCRIKDGGVGFCRVRRHQDGKLYTLNYGRCTAVALDPIEKKPLYHFHPGAVVLSLGTVGCNLRCGFCQNWQISQGEGATESMPPERAVEMADDLQADSGCLGLAYTYSEPFMWYEYVLDTARLARDRGHKNILVTNGYVREEPLRRLLPYIDAMNIDLKAFTEHFYQATCSGRLEPVKKTIAAVYGQCHLELTTLIIPTLNDSAAEITRLTDWIADLGDDIPLHFSRYFPAYRFSLPPTPLATLVQARDIARRRLRHVYIGNVEAEDGLDTYCPGCGAVVVRRDGYRVSVAGLSGGKCKECGTPAGIVSC
ncbi:MAG: AmmeMemoRadiSam system radical SAM enzyme [bacterium]